MLIKVMEVSSRWIEIDEEELAGILSEDPVSYWDWAWSDLNSDYMGIEDEIGNILWERD